MLWGVAFAAIVRGLPVDADEQMHLGVTDLLNGYTLLGGLATAGLFAFHGAVFIRLKTEGAVRVRATHFAALLGLPVTVVVAGFGLWTQVFYGKDWTWLAFGIAVAAQLTAVMLVGTRQRRLGIRLHGRGGRLRRDPALRLALPERDPSSLDPAWSLTVDNASSAPYTLTIMSWAALLITPLVIGYQGWTYWVFRQRISAERIPDPIGLSRRTR